MNYTLPTGLNCRPGIKEVVLRLQTGRREAMASPFQSVHQAMPRLASDAHSLRHLDEAVSLETRSNDTSGTAGLSTIARVMLLLLLHLVAHTVLTDSQAPV